MMTLPKWFILDNINFNEKKTIKKNFNDKDKTINTSIYIMDESDFLLSYFAEKEKLNSKIKLYCNYEKFKTELNIHIDSVEKELTTLFKNKKLLNYFIK